MKSPRTLSAVIASRPHLSPRDVQTQAQDLPQQLIYPRSDARPVSPDRVLVLAESISEIGLINPIVVRPVQKSRHGQLTDAWEILAGHHRFQACSLHLRMDSVPCIVRDEDDLHAELVMIDENLCRAGLSPAQEALQTTRRKELYELLHPDAKRGAAGATARWDAPAKLADAFSRDTAERTGRSERAVQRDAARGEALAADLPRIAGTSLDKGVELDALAKMQPEQREPLIHRATKGEAVSARETKSAAPERASPKRPVSAPDLSRIRDGQPLEDLPIEELRAMAEAAERELRAIRAEIARRAKASGERR